MPAPHEVVWEVENLGVGERVSFELITRVSLGKEPGLVRNAVKVLNKDGEEEDTDTNEEVEVVDIEKVELMINKSILNSFVRIGEKISFEIYLKNTGSLDLKNLVITDTLSSQLKFLSSVLPFTDNGNGIYTWKIEELESGDSISWEFDVELDYLPQLISKEIINRVWVTAEAHPDRWSSEVKAEVFGPVWGELDVEKKLEGDLFRVGDIVQYGISILNKGDHRIWNVKLVDYFPIGLQFLDFVGPGALQLFDSDSLEISVPVLEIGQQLDFTLSFMLLEFSQDMVNVATVSADNAPSVSDSTEAIVLQEVDLAILKEVSSGFVEVGKEFSYKISISNLSDVGASSIEVLDVIPQEMEYVKSIYFSGAATFNVSERVLKWEIEKLEPREELELTVLVRATAVGNSISNSAIITSREPDSDYSNNESSVIHNQFSIHFPNVFTPNGDGINDSWEITGINLFPNNSLVIVNRWGVEVFATDNYTNDWTGRNLVEGTYFYSFKWRDPSNQEYEKTGFIHLKR